MSFVSLRANPVLDLEKSEAVEAAPAAKELRRRDHFGPSLRSGGIIILLAILAVLIDGYHPYAEDAGIYVAGIRKALHPSLYPSSSPFITAYSRLSLFPRWNAWVIRFLGIPLDSYLFLAHLLTTWLLLFAGFQLARKCFQKAEAVWASVALTAVCLAVPVAASALSMMDPYVTGRSFSTPLTLFAINALLDRRPLRAVALGFLVGASHPLMLIYAVGFLLMLWAVHRRSWIGVATLVAAALAAAEVVQYSQRDVVESAAYRVAVSTRDYFFLCHWQTYELFGLLAPLVLMAVYVTSRTASQNGKILCETCILVGLTSIAVSLVFAQPSNQSHLVAALQTIRTFLILYLIMFLLLGGVLGEYVLKHSPWRWMALLMGPVIGLSFAQHQTYPSSLQVELPGIKSRNDWHQAFDWIHSNTAPDAMFALDSDYIHAPGEDALGFRALAERDALADRSKDGGAAAIFPQLADRWLIEQTATTDLNTISDAQRLHRLAPFKVTWIVLDGNSATAFACPFQTATVKVCYLL